MVSRDIFKFGYCCALVSGCACIAFTLVQLMQTLGITTYPFDAVLINATSLCIAPPFLLAVLALHYAVPAVKKFYTNAAVLFAAIYNVFAMYIYAIQLATVLPYHVTDPVLTVTPHSLFWTVDALAYINMGITALFLVTAFSGIKFSRRPRLWFLLHALATPVIALVYFFPAFSTPLLMLGSVWSVTSVSSLFSLAWWFKKQGTITA